MTRAFADTCYWIALANPHDQWNAAANNAGRSLETAQIVTTDEVMVEFLTFFSGLGPKWRRRAVRFAREVFADPDVVVLPQTRHSFQAGLGLYERRPDKHYSLTDCISMETMREYALAEVLTNDRHFVQEGFSVLWEG